MWVQTLVFLIFIGFFFILNIVTPDKKFSQQENRTLQTAPEFSFSALRSGKFTSTYETYVTDQFALRDKWISLKAGSELASGKDANNGIYMCRDETLIEGFEEPDYDDVDFSLDAINTLGENFEGNVYFALIPSASEIWSAMLPEGTPNYSQAEVISHAYDYVNVNTIDIYSALKEHEQESIFYRTDHHWTTLGAYYGYTAVVKAMGMEPVSLDEYAPTVVTDSFYGTTYSSSGFSWVKPDSITTYVQQGDVKITNYPDGSPTEGELYDADYLELKDKYSYFYGGNTPLLEIDTGTSDDPSLLIVRDSYMDSLSPFLFSHFSSISIIDLRYYKASLKSYIEANGFDDVLVCYSVPNFVTDKNIFLAGR
jgi:hypothetical protein